LALTLTLTLALTLPLILAERRRRETEEGGDDERSEPSHDEPFLLCFSQTPRIYGIGGPALANVRVLAEF
jgi:hypothetical protein